MQARQMCACVKVLIRRCTTRPGVRFISTRESTESGKKGRPYKDIPMANVNTITFARNMDQGHKMTCDMHETHGPILRFKLLGLGKIVTIADPDVLEQVMRNEGRYPIRIEMKPWINALKELDEAPGILTAEREDWYSMRNASNKILLSTKHVAHTAEGMNDVAVDFLQYLCRKRSDDNVIRLSDETVKWSLEGICNVLYGTRLGLLSDEPSPDGRKFAKAVINMIDTTSKLIIVPFPKLFAPKLWKLHVESWKTMYEIARRYIQQKKDLVAENEEEADGSLLHGVLKHCEENNLSEKQSVSVILELMAGGVDTTSQSVTFAFAELARHQDIQTKLVDEIRRVVPDNENPQPCHLQSTPLLRGVVKETLRLYPIATSAGRVLQEDSVIKGYTIHAGTLVSIPLYYLGRKETLFEKANEFHPERWLRDQTKKHELHPFAFLPFGFGTRGCVGRRVAEMEMHLLIAQMVRRFRIEPVNNDPIKTKLRMTLISDGPVDVKLLDR